ncbi:MAG: amino acid ABC transporter permease, partial [Clostridia bacterium]|nr:amino acid ABC transporter permease [Clostridia bacterium]
HTQELGFVVRTDDLAYKDEDVTVDEETFWESIKDSFHKTFVEQKRWQLILSGLLSTLIITVFGFILANVLGAAACAMAMAKSKILKAIASAYSSIMQGTPMVVVLLILYYVIFGHSSLSGTIVAIIGFGLVTGAYMAQLFQGALQGVDKGQIEASLALGFSKAKTFRYIIFPQALRSAITGYFSQIISLLKSTAIVGYIAVNDLTKVGDIIRSSTYESLFPLLSIAIIYFLVAALLLFILRRCLSALAYKRGYKKIKGVSL